MKRDIIIITKAVENKYLKNPHFCPKCKGSSVVADNWDGESQSQSIYCDDCGFNWREVFSMVGIESKG
jgi:predicted RNA-binding Zn-ribbon protein involved in translation (DUF1610 family)